MFAEAIQKSILEWLQLTPELLSGLGRPVVRTQPRVAAVAAPKLDVTTTSDVAPISLQSVLPTPTGMSFHHLPDDGSSQRTYVPMENGGQRAALAEMTGYLTTRLAPSPMEAGI